MNKEEFISSKMRLSKEDIIEDYYKTEENLVKYLGIEHENYKLQQENKKQKEVINKAIEYINSNPNVFYDEHLIDVETLKNNEMTDDYVGEIRFISNLLDILKEVSE